MSRDEVYLRHILDAIARIESYVSPGRDAFFANPMARTLSTDTYPDDLGVHVV